MNLRTKCRQYSPGFAGLVLVMFVGSLQSDSYRCGSKLVRTGDASGRVLKICGEPRHKDRGREKIRLNGQPKDVSVERWYYQKGSQSLERVILLHRGRVVAIETQSR